MFWRWELNWKRVALCLGGNEGSELRKFNSTGVHLSAECWVTTVATDYNKFEDEVNRKQRGGGGV